MTRGLLQGSTRLMAFAAELAMRRVALSIERGPFARWRWPGSKPERLVIAPQDIRTADPTVAADIYAGLFVLSGQVVETGGRSPFELKAPSAAWARELHSFSWLRHLRAADNVLARQNARALVADWIGQESRVPAEAYETEVLARRALAWVTQSPLILEEADRAFYRRFLRSLVRQVRRLRMRVADMPDGYPRLLAAIAIAEFAVSARNQDRLVRQANERLADELGRQILPDGGHLSRDPGVIVEVLTDLLPLRQAYATRGIAPSPVLMTSIDRMMPMLRFFRHTDGTLASFNGRSSVHSDQLATLLAYDDTRGTPVGNAAYSGYQRIEAAGTVLIMDCGALPPLSVSQRCHAGCLAFEMSSGFYRFIVNCGASDEPGWREASRSTAAHSTLVIEDRSSARFVSDGWIARRVGPVMTAGPREVTVSRSEEPGAAIRIVASHDGYRAAFGFVHERSIVVGADGTEIVGVDRLVGGKEARHDRFAIRFHLHPQIKASMTAGGDVLLVAPDGEAWTFASTVIAPELEDSVSLSDVYGRRRSRQIVLNGRARSTPEVAWSLTRTAAGQRQRPKIGREGTAAGPDLFSA